MAFFNEAWFIHAVNDNVVQLAQQRESKVTGALRRREGVTGKTDPWQRIGSEDMVPQTARDADTVYANPPQSKRRAVLRDFSLAVLIDDFDTVKTLTNPQSEFAQILAYARNRKLDDLVIGVSTAGIGGILGLATTVDEAAESTGTQANTQSIAAGGAGLTMAKVRQSVRMLDANDVPEEDRYFFVSPVGMEDLLADTTVTSSDYNTIRVLNQGGFPQDATWMGYKWRKTTRLPISGNNRSCIAMHKMAAGLSVGMFKDIEVDKAVHKNNATQVLIKLSAGTVRVDELGVVEVIIDESV